MAGANPGAPPLPGSQQPVVNPNPPGTTPTGNNTANVMQTGQTVYQQYAMQQQQQQQKQQQQNWMQGYQNYGQQAGAYNGWGYNPYQQQQQQQYAAAAYGNQYAYAQQQQYWQSMQTQGYAWNGAYPQQYQQQQQHYYPKAVQAHMQHHNKKTNQQGSLGKVPAAMQRTTVTASATNQNGANKTMSSSSSSSSSSSFAHNAVPPPRSYSQVAPPSTYRAVRPPSSYQQAAGQQKRKFSYAQIVGATHSSSSSSSTHSAAALLSPSGTNRKSRFGPKSPSNKQQQKQQMQQYPPSLQRYVTRAFNSVKSSQKRQVEMYLALKIKGAQQAGTLATIDWDNEPLPLGGGRPSGSKVMLNMSGGKRKGRGSRLQITKNKQRQPDYSFGDCFDDDDDSSQPGSSKKKRKKRKNKNKRSELMAIVEEFDSKKRENRLNRFREFYATDNAGGKKNKKYMKKAKNRGYVLTGDLALDWEKLKIVGTCETLEKNYFRLNCAPEPEKVRPQRVLEKTYAMLLDKWKTDKDYPYTNDQFQSMRQDLMIQNIRNEFAVKTYETHARIALECGDMFELFKCLRQLKYLYSIKGEHRTNYAEFMSYKLLYLTLTEHKLDLVPFLRCELTPNDRKNPAVRFALDVYQAVSGGNWVLFFRLYKNAPLLCKPIMDKMADGVRLHALIAAAKGYRMLKVPVSYLTRTLNFETDSACVQFMVECGAALNDDQTELLPKQCTNLHPPEREEEDDEDKVRKGGLRVHSNNS